MMQLMGTDICFMQAMPGVRKLYSNSLMSLEYLKSVSGISVVSIRQCGVLLTNGKINV